jgi:hypothetical protein
MTETRVPKMKSSEAQYEIEKCKARLDAFENQVKDLTQDRMNQAPKEESEQQTKLSSKQIEKAKDIYLKPKRVIACSTKDKFNEKFREQMEFAKQYVQFIAEHKELIGDSIEIWTRPFGGMPAEEWEVPTNKPVWGPRYLAEQIKRKCYHRLIMTQNVRGEDGMGQYYGQMAADKTIQRLDAYPVSQQKSLFMGAANF